MHVEVGISHVCHWCRTSCALRLPLRRTSLLRLGASSGARVAAPCCLRAELCGAYGVVGTKIHVPCHSHAHDIEVMPGDHTRQIAETQLPNMIPTHN